ncbi:MAG: hypothetical protein HOY71_39475, partial [Nonomuraea sp.]|nr:hypothetical protein [Nonomuraea sp.]
PGYVSCWKDGAPVPRIAWYPADLAGYRSNVIKSDLKLAVAADGALTITDWNGGAVDTAQVSWEVSDGSLGSVVNGRLVRTGKPGWLTVRGIVTLDGVPRYSSVELVKTPAGQA